MTDEFKTALDRIKGPFKWRIAVTITDQDFARRLRVAAAKDGRKYNDILLAELKTFVNNQEIKEKVTQSDPRLP